MSSLRYGAAALLLFLSGTAAFAQNGSPYPYQSSPYLSWAPADPAESVFREALPPQAMPEESDDAAAIDRQADVPARLHRQVVDYPARHAPGTIVIDTAHTYLYYVLGNGRAIRYGIGVGREGFTWSGVEPVSRKAEWPDWIPPA
jgi:lipoprotein-anchoring transpeptidase ErfK/SrfK